MTTNRLKSALKKDLAFSKDKIIKTKTILKKSYTIRKTTKPRLKFAGPIKILIIEPKSEYCRTVWCAVGVGLTHMCIGATNFSVLQYSIQNGDSHATVCCLAVSISPALTFTLIFEACIVLGMLRIFVNPSGNYCNYVLCAIGIGFSHVIIGATLMVILYYSLTNSFSDLHIMLCSFGFHFFSAEAILSLNYANGWSTPMRLRHRRLAHVLLQLCGVACVITGTVLAVLAKGVSLSLHGLTGLIAAGLAGISVISGLLALLAKRPWLVTVHMSFGIPAFLVSSISLCSGLFSKQFKDWAGLTIVYILIAFVAFYTTFIIASSFLKCLSRI